MTDGQVQWMTDNPRFKSWRPKGIVTTTGWTDVGYVTPAGEFIPDGKGVPFMPNLISTEDALYMVPKGCIKVGREYAIV